MQNHLHHEPNTNTTNTNDVRHNSINQQPFNNNDKNNQLEPLSTPHAVFNQTVLSIIITETAERFAYYGFRAVLVLYFTDVLKLSDNQAVADFAWMTSFAYFTCVIGAILSDAVLGPYETIKKFGFMYGLGLFLLTAGAYAGGIKSLTFGGLFFICLGTGGIKPVVSTFGADQVLFQYKTHDDDGNGDIEGADSSETANMISRQETIDSNSDNNNDKTNVCSSTISSAEAVRDFFAYFYFGINVGSLFSFLTVPVIKARFGFGAAFLCATVFLLVAMIVFVSHRHSYYIRSPKQNANEGSVINNNSSNLLNILEIYWTMIKQKFNFKVSAVVFDEQLQLRFSQGEINDAQSVLKLVPIFSTLPMFWALYDQQASVWVLQAQKMNLHGLQPEQMGILNPLLILILVPLFEKGLYPWCEAKSINMHQLRRMGYGMFLTSLSFFMSGYLQSFVEKKPEGVNIGWQLPQIVVLAIAEVLVSVTGLEFAYSNSPGSMKSFIMASFLLTVSVGDLFAGLLYSLLSSLDDATILYICAVLMLVTLLLFVVVERRWIRQHEMNFC